MIQSGVNAVAKAFKGVQGRKYTGKSVLLFEEASTLLDNKIFGQIYKPKVII